MTDERIHLDPADLTADGFKDATYRPVADRLPNSTLENALDVLRDLLPSTAEAERAFDVISAALARVSAEPTYDRSDDESTRLVDDRAGEGGNASASDADLYVSRASTGRVGVRGGAGDHVDERAGSSAGLSRLRRDPALTGCAEPTEDTIAELTGTESKEIRDGLNQIRAALSDGVTQQERNDAMDTIERLRTTRGPLGRWHSVIAASRGVSAENKLPAPPPVSSGDA